MKTQFATRRLYKNFKKEKKIPNTVGIHLSLKEIINVNISWRMIEAYYEHLNEYFSFHD